MSEGNIRRTERAQGRGWRVHRERRRREDEKTRRPDDQSECAAREAACSGLYGMRFQHQVRHACACEGTERTTGAESRIASRNEGLCAVSHGCRLHWLCTLVSNKRPSRFCYQRDFALGCGYMPHLHAAGWQAVQPLSAPAISICHPSIHPASIISIHHHPPAHHPRHRSRKSLSIAFTQAREGPKFRRATRGHALDGPER